MLAERKDIAQIGTYYDVRAGWVYCEAEDTATPKVDQKTRIDYAISEAGTKTLLFPQGDYFIDTNITIANDIEFATPARLDVQSGKTVIITGNIKAGPSQIFTGAGTISFVGNTKLLEVYPEWWGASPSASATINTTAINKALAACTAAGGGTVRLSKGTYNINGSLLMGSSVALVGNRGEANTIISGAFGDSMIKSPNTNLRYNFWRIENISFTGISSVANSIGIDMRNISRSVIKNCSVYNFVKGISLTSSGNTTTPAGAALYNIVDGCRVLTCTTGIECQTDAGSSYGAVNAITIRSTQITVVTTGILVKKAVSINIIGGSIEAFVTGIDIQTDADSVFIEGVHLEVVTGPYTGINIATGAVWTTIIRPRWGGGSYTFLVDNGTNSLLIDTYYPSSETRTKKVMVYNASGILKTTLEVDQLLDLFGPAQSDDSDYNVSTVMRLQRDNTNLTHSDSGLDVRLGAKWAESNRIYTRADFYIRGYDAGPTPDCLAMTFLATGWGTNANVGIGTVVPLAKLAINGGLAVGEDADPGDNNLKVVGTATIGSMTTAGFVKNAVTTGLLSGGNTLAVSDIPSMTSAEFATKISDETGTDKVVLNTSPVLVTPTLGVAKANSINATDGNGLALYEDGGAGIFVKDGGNVGIGTTNPLSKLSVYGSNSDSTAGPHIRVLTNADSYPLLEVMSYCHDNISLNFDAYYDGGWKSSDAGSNFNIYKFSDLLRFSYDSGITQGSGVTWKNAMTINASGNVGINTITQSAKLAINGGLHVGGDSDPGDNNLKVVGNAEIDGDLNHDGAGVGFFGKAPAVQQTGIAALKVNYTSGDLDSEAEIISALNTTNTAINALRTALNALGLTTTI